MYIACDVSLLSNPLQNAHQCQCMRTCKKKTMFIDFIIKCFPSMKQFLKPLNRLELSIFTTIVSCISNKKNSIFLKLKIVDISFS